MSTDSILVPNLHITLAHVGQGIQIGPLWIAYYGICIAAAMMAGIYLAMYLAKRTGQDPDRYFNFAVAAVILSVLGARIYYVIFSWDYYGKHPAQIMDLRGGGLAIYGGVITGVICAVAYCRRKKMNLRLFLDTGLPAVTLGQAIGRWGNFFNREVFGGYTNGPAAMALPADILPADEVTQAMLEHPLVRDGIIFVQVHPTFLYESLWNLLLLILMTAIILKGRKKFDGEIACLYLLGYGIGRFWIEGIRTDQLLIPGTALPVSQVLSGVIAVAGLGLLAAGHVKRRNDTIHGPNDRE